MTCDKCKWWVEQDEYSNSRGILHTCEQPKAKIGYQWSSDDMPKDGIWIENDEGWGWFTGPKFGCVNYETH